MTDGGKVRLLMHEFGECFDNIQFYERVEKRFIKMMSPQGQWEIGAISLNRKRELEEHGVKASGNWWLHEEDSTASWQVLDHSVDDVLKAMVQMCRKEQKRLKKKLEEIEQEVQENWKET